MNTVTQRTSPATGSAPEPRQRRTPTWSDGLGDRALVFDSASASSLELLQLRAELTTRPELLALLTKRIQLVSQLRHPLVAASRSIERAESGQGLVLVSPHVAGRRLSEIIMNARGPAFAVEFIRQVSPALMALQQLAPGVAHGLLTPDRIVVTREGRLVVVEAVLGPAVQALALPAARLRGEFGLALPDIGQPIPLDQRLDVLQMGFIALSLVLGRRLDPADYRHRIPALLDEFGAAAPSEVRALRPWLEHALQMTERPFESALDAAEAAMAMSPADTRSDTVAIVRPAAELAPQALEPTVPPIAPAAPVSPAPVPVATAAPMPKIASAAMTPRPAVASSKVSEESMMPSPSAPVAALPAAAPVRAVVTAPRFGWIHWLAAGLALVAGGEAIVIAKMIVTAPVPTATVTIAAPLPAASASVTSFDQRAADLTATPAASPVALAGGASPAPAAEASAGEAKPAAAGIGKFGGIKVTSPIELQILENGSMLGSSGAPIALAEGTHALDLVNDGLAYRSKQTVAVKPGQMTAVQISVPQGKININAAPWASVWIDGNAAGDTPLANVSLPIGAHEVLFRHPQLGEQRMTAVVKAEGVARVSASFQR